jgi:hypothetical protein
MNSFEKNGLALDGLTSKPFSVCRPNQKDILSSLIEEVSGDFLPNLDPFIRVSRQAGDVSCSLAAENHYYWC